MTTPEEALRRIKAVEEKVDKQLKEDAENMKKLLSTNQDLGTALDREKRRADKLLSEKEGLERKLDGFGDLVKALGKIRGESVDPGKVREIVREEFGKLPGLDTPAGDATLTRVKRALHVKEEKRAMPEYSTLSTDGKILDLVTEGFFDSQRRVSDVCKKLDHIPESTLRSALATLAERELLVEKRGSAGERVYIKHPDLEVSLVGK